MRHYGTSRKSLRPEPYKRHPCNASRLHCKSQQSLKDLFNSPVQGPSRVANAFPSTKVCFLKVPANRRRHYGSKEIIQVPNKPFRSQVLMKAIDVTFQAKVVHND